MDADVTEPVASEPRRWPLFAARRGADESDRGQTSGEFHNFYPHPGLVRMCGFSEVHPVWLVEDPNGPLLGWLDAPKEPDTAGVSAGQDDDLPSMVQHHRIFEIQFPYGSAVEVERGHGTVVALRAEPRGVPGPDDPEENR